MAERLVRELGITLRSRWKGGVLGDEVLERMMNEESAAGPHEDLPDIRNAEGHELVFTTLRWDVWEAGARECLARMGRDHSLAWCDMVIPSLGNRGPRSLVKTEKGRLTVEALLAEFERHQAASPGNPSPLDLDLIRRELGLDREA